MSFPEYLVFCWNLLIIVSLYVSMQETLRKAEETFGPDNKDLYAAFDGLLSRHLPF